MNRTHSFGNLSLGAAALLIGTLVSSNAIASEGRNQVRMGDMESTVRKCGSCALNEADIASWSYSNPVGKPLEARVADHAARIGAAVRDLDHGRGNVDVQHGFLGTVGGGIFASAPAGGPRTSPVAAAAPEIDANLWSSGLTLLLGGLAVLTGVRRSRLSR